MQTSFLKALRDTWQRVGISVNLGIVAHLAIAFIAVAALAIGANVIAVHGTLLVHTTTTAPAKALTTPTAIPLPPPPPAAETPLPPEAKPIDIAGLNSALDRYDRVTLNRTEENSAEQRQQFALAREDLKTEARAYIAAANGLVERSRLQRLIAQLSERQNQSIELVRIADARRALLQRYWLHFEAMDARMKATLEGAWKIFGRVVTRESLVELSAHLNDLRSHLASLAAPPLDRANGQDAIVASENAIAATLEQERRELHANSGGSVARGDAQGSCRSGRYALGASANARGVRPRVETVHG